MKKIFGKLWMLNWQMSSLLGKILNKAKVLIKARFVLNKTSGKSSFALVLLHFLQTLV